jgi:hypothetical protein
MKSQRKVEHKSGPGAEIEASLILTTADVHALRWGDIVFGLGAAPLEVGRGAWS